MDRSLLWLLWTPVPLPLRQQTKDSLHRLQNLQENTDILSITLTRTIYENRVFDSKGKADSTVEIQFGPNIKDWPEMPGLTDNLVLKVVSEIHDPVTTTDELIPSGETSSYRSNPLKLAEFCPFQKGTRLMWGLQKKSRRLKKAREAGECPACALNELKPVWDKIKEAYPEMNRENTGVGSTIFAVKPGDGSAREQGRFLSESIGRLGKYCE